MFLCVLPMNKKSTPLTAVSNIAALVKLAVRSEQTAEPKETTLRYLKAVARNLRANGSLPHGLQEYVLS